tara:strand:- start:2168 stop:2329 length:162 start_codon:yes stop_codon:yes gene_type:complete
VKRRKRLIAINKEEFEEIKEATKLSHKNSTIFVAISVINLLLTLLVIISLLTG